MAKTLSSESSLTPIFFFFLTLSTTIIIFFSTHATATNHSFSRPLSPKKLGLKRQKLSHLHFYFHDIVSGRNPTAIRVAESKTTKTSKSFFGAVVIMDDPLTVSPEPTSKLVGRAQGIYAAASQSELGFLMVLNYVFLEGKYNGSTLSILGHNAPISKVREMPIVGGSGLFRFATGYAQAKTHTIDFNTGDAVVEYNVYVFHY